jgi:hypothetical protein
MKYTFLLILLVLIGCASKITTTFQHDKTADYTKYKTYNYAPEALKIPLSDQNRKNVLEAIDKEMVKKGFTKADQGDVIVDLLAKTDTKLQTVIVQNQGVLQPLYYGYGPGYTTERFDAREYEEGTLFIIFADRKTNYMLWQGRATKVLNPSATDRQMKKNIGKAIKMIFKGYPPFKCKTC